MSVIRVDTEASGPFREWLDDRHERGLDTYDEWWEGELRFVTGPTPEHGELVGDLMEFLGPLVRYQGFRKASTINIGIDKSDCRVPDIGIYDPDTARTSPAFLSTAVMVIEILSPGEKAGEKLPFYAAWEVQEYLEISLTQGTVRLLKRHGDDWRPALASQLGFSVTEDELYYLRGPADERARLDVTHYQIGAAPQTP